MYCLLVTGFFLIPDISFEIISEKNHLTAFFSYAIHVKKWVAISEELESKNGNVFTM